MSAVMRGQPAPWFKAFTHARPDFAFSSVAGRYVLLGFLPSEAGLRRWALAALDSVAELFDDRWLTSFMVTRDRATFDAAQHGVGRRWFLDPSGEISQIYGAVDPHGDPEPLWVLIDPSMRVMATFGLSQTLSLIELMQGLPGVDDHAGTALHAPVLIIPRVLEPELCRALIAYYEADGGQPSGVMRQIDGMTVGVLDDFKKRRDATIADEALQAELRSRIQRAVVPEIKKSFQFTATRIERYIVACYDAQDGGYFRPHRDNTTNGTAHRRFAVSINLNAEDHEGGDLRFPEFGWRSYRPPTGGAVVFSCSLLHEATPVTRGRRYATLPFLHDDAAEAQRQMNALALQQPAAGVETSEGRARAPVYAGAQ